MYKGIRLGFLCMHSRSHNNAIRAWKDEKPAWCCVLGEMICVCLCLCVFGGLYRAQATVKTLVV